jgi:hypothetical protein
MKCKTCEHFIPFSQRAKNDGIVLKNRDDDDKNHHGGCKVHDGWNVSPEHHCDDYKWNKKDNRWEGMSLWDRLN